MTAVSLPLIERDAVVILVPACNEAGQIEDTLRSLQSQTRTADAIIVIANNCTDNTAELALAAGARVMTMKHNDYQKAGALNHAIGLLLAGPLFPEFTVTIDADTILDEHFVERAVHLLRHNQKLGGVSAVCRGKGGLGSNPYQRSLAWLQSAEYSRAGLTRVRYNIHTLSGAGSVLRAEAILDVIRDRGMLYAQRKNNLVEDYEATLEIKRHGWECTNNYHCVAYTDLMLSMRALLKQRIRWVRGSVDELRRRGWQSETKVSILALGWALLGMPLFYFWMWLVVRTLVAGNIAWTTGLLMTIIGFYQAFTIRSLGWRAMLASFVLLPELVFNLVRHVWLIASFVQSYRAKNAVWE